MASVFYDTSTKRPQALQRNPKGTGCSQFLCRALGSALSPPRISVPPPPPFFFPSPTSPPVPFLILPLLLPLLLFLLFLMPFPLLFPILILLLFFTFLLLLFFLLFFFILQLPLLLSSPAKSGGVSHQRELDSQRAFLLCFQSHPRFQQSCLFSFLGKVMRAPCVYLHPHLMLQKHRATGFLSTP